MNKLVVITGCSGGGKSTILSNLRKKGYSVIPEVGRELVKEQLVKKSGITPWENPNAFCELLIERSIAAYYAASKIMNAKDDVVFLDRCILEGISYYQSLDIHNANKYDHFIDELRYYPVIFVTPPWQEIYCVDDERKHSFEEALIEHERVLKLYPQCGYRIIDLPKKSVEERLEFILSSIALEQCSSIEIKKLK